MRRLLVVISFLFSAGTLARADSGNPLPANDDQWRFTIAFPMVWAPNIDGKVRGGEDIDFEITFGEIIENLSAGIMAELYANRGPFGLAFRVSYLNTKNEEFRSGNIIDVRSRTDLRMAVADLSASWKVHEKVRLLTGVRLVGAKMDIELQSSIGGNELPPVNVPVTDDAKYDFLIGINLDHWFNDNWGIMFNTDVGVFGDNDRDFNAEFRALYRLGSLNNFWFGYRLLNIGNDSTTDGVEYKVDMTQAGPTIGWAFTF